MHIPDGYLSPKTCVVFYAAMLPIWYFAFRAAGRAFGGAKAPLISFGAAFVFVIMMFNFPVPGGTTGHISGAPLLAIVFGPLTAIAAVSLALLLQAAIFADGGITTYAANSFIIAATSCFVSSHVFNLLGGGNASSLRVKIAAFFSGYAAIVMAAFVLSLTLGIQPLVGSTSDGIPLYAPYGLEIAIPAVLLSHAFFIAIVEGAATSLIAPYALGLLREGALAHGKALPKVFSALIVLVCLTPLGLMFPGTPWGEWGVAELKNRLGYVPEGVVKGAGFWQGLLPDYSVAGISKEAGYVISALIGTAILLTLIYFIERKRRQE